MKVKCKDGLNPSAADFDLSDEELDWVQAAFPELSEFGVNIKADSGVSLGEDEVEEFFQEIFSGETDLIDCDEL